MTWEELTSQEKTALRHLAKGEVQEVPWRLIRRLGELGLADDNPEGRLTPARIAEPTHRDGAQTSGRVRTGRNQAVSSL